MKKPGVCIAAVILLAVCLLCSCGRSGKHCTVTFRVSYSGGDIAGNDLGSGGFEQKLTVRKGTALSGSDKMYIQEKPDEHTWIEIVDLDENGVTYLLRNDITDKGTQITANYGVETKSHDTVVFDSTSYYRKMVFSDFSE